MYVTDIYFGPVSKVTYFEYVGPTWDITKIAHSKKDRNTFLYHTGKNGKECYMDIITKEIYPCDPFDIKEGECFINSKHELVPFAEVLSILHSQNIPTVNIGKNPTRGKVLKLLKNCNNALNRR